MAMNHLVSTIQVPVDLLSDLIGDFIGRGSLTGLLICLSIWALNLFAQSL
ncbi:predicted protein [Arabidopsis lyrata subsp. lyrata]|uniref:Predicted protein n=1 Tax=Arabidopsis lyrata subsp. lyrata TaxID=81972 RepID=D7L153_ARALL|nr:predicted protein [Arabidopsis lyrata subsp. lyrata]